MKYIPYKAFLASCLMFLYFCTGARGQAVVSIPRENFVQLSRDDISAGFGWMLPIVPSGSQASDCSNGTMFRVDYRHFFANRTGFGVGAQHVWNYMDVPGSIGMPVSFVCRTRLHDFGEQVGKGLRNAIDNDPFEDYERSYPPEDYNYSAARGFFSDVGVFLLSLVNRAEFNVGLTPGYIYGDGKVHRTSYSVIAGGDRFDWSGMKGTEVGSRFCLSADVGATLSYRIWHFCINLSPELHYIVTDSYRIYSKPDKGIAETSPQKWQFSFMFSLDLML